MAPKFQDLVVRFDGENGNLSIFDFVDSLGLVNFAQTSRSSYFCANAVARRRLGFNGREGNPSDQCSGGFIRRLRRHEILHETASPAGMRYVAAGAYHSVYIVPSLSSAPDMILGMGDGVLGRLGEANSEKSRWSPLWYPTMVFPGVQAKLIKQVTCGYHHTAFLMSDGSLYIYGVVGRQAFITQALDSTAHGESLYSPSRVQYIPPEHKASRPLQISSGSSTLAWVTASGEVIIHTTSGFRPFRVRAFGNHKELQFGKATQVSCGARHIAVVNSFGQLFTWGWNQHGQLGHGNTINELGPRQVIFPDKISENVRIVACATGTKHTAALSDRGHLYLFGDGSSGQLGQNDLSPRTRPTRCTAGVLSERTVSQVVCGETFTAVLTNKGEVVVLGKFEGVHDHEHPDSHSQYTAEESVHASNLRSMQVQIPAQHYRLYFYEGGCEAAQLAAGKSHLLVRLDNNHTVTYGVGKTGQLGHGTLTKQLDSFKNLSATPPATLFQTILCKLCKWFKVYQRRWQQTQNPKLDGEQRLKVAGQLFKYHRFFRKVFIRQWMVALPLGLLLGLRTLKTIILIVKWFAFYPIF